MAACTGKKYKTLSGIDDPSSTPIQSLHSIMTNTAALHKKEDFENYLVLCYRTDYSDDAKWKRLLELADDLNVGCKGVCKPCKGTDFMHVVEGRQYENITVEDLQPIATDTFVIADKQSMEDETFLLAHNDPVWEEDEETGEGVMVDTVLKSGRYPASEIWVPVTSLPISNCDWDEIMPYHH
ncbi:unnamed protein product [Umbelopsis ramanniana]